MNLIKQREQIDDTGSSMDSKFGRKVKLEQEKHVTVVSNVYSHEEFDACVDAEVPSPQNGADIIYVAKVIGWSTNNEENQISECDPKLKHYTARVHDVMIWYFKEEEEEEEEMNNIKRLGILGKWMDGMPLWVTQF